MQRKPGGFEAEQTDMSGHEESAHVEHLKIVPEDKDRHAKHDTSQPLDEHLREALCVFLRKCIEEIAAQEVEEHTLASKWSFQSQDAAQSGLINNCESKNMA